MTLRILSPVVEEIADAALWLNERAEGLGDEFWRLVDTTLSQVAENPLRYGKSEFADAEFDFRFAFVERFKYVIHFLVEGKEIIVVAVAHAARRPGYWLCRVRTS